MLSEEFNNLLVKIGNPNLEHPIFYNTPIGMRFEIGTESPVYLKSSNSNHDIVNPQYIASALYRAKAIYAALPHAPNLLRIDLYPNEEELGKDNRFGSKLLQNLFQSQYEEITKQVDDDGVPYTISQYYWNLDTLTFLPDLLLKEIIEADLGGVSALVSSVYFANTDDVYLYHLYDDRGADLVAESREILYQIYRTFNDWILDYDKKQIDTLFVK